MQKLRTPYSKNAGRYSELGFPTAATSSTSLTEIRTIPSDRSGFKLCAAEWIASGAIAQSDTNYCVISILNSTGGVMASWSSKLTGGQGAATAGTHVTLVVGAVAAVWANPSTALRVQIAITGTLSVPAGYLRFEGDLL